MYTTRVIVKDAETGEIVHDRTGDHLASKFRLWINKTVFWAVRNNYRVTLIPMGDTDDQ